MNSYNPFQIGNNNTSSNFTRTSTNINPFITNQNQSSQSSLTNPFLPNNTNSSGFTFGNNSNTTTTTTINPFLPSNTKSNTNSFLFNNNTNNNNNTTNSTISTNPFLSLTNNNTQNNNTQTSINYTNPFLPNNNNNNGRFSFSSLNTNNNTNNNNSILNNPFISSNNNTTINFSPNNGGNVINPFLPSSNSNNNNSSLNNNNPFIKSNNTTSNNNINVYNPFLQNSNNNNKSSDNSNPFTNLLNNNSNNNNNSNPFMLLNSNNNNNSNLSSFNNNNNLFNNSNNIFNNNNNNNNNNFNLFNNNNSSNNSNPFIRNNNNNIFNSNNTNSNSTIKFGFTPTINTNTTTSTNLFSQSNYNNNTNISSNTNIFNTNNNFNNSYSNLFNNNFNNNSNIINTNYSHSQKLQNINKNNIFSSLNYKNDNENKKEIDNAESLSKSVPLSRILSLRFQSPEFLEEVLMKLNEDKDNIKLFKTSIGMESCKDFIIDSILSSKSKDDKIVKYEKDDEFSILKQKKLEQKNKKERIKEEERYQKYLKDLFKKNEKEELNRITKSTTQKNKTNKINNNNNNNNKRYSSQSNSNYKGININNLYEDNTNNTIIQKKESIKSDLNSNKISNIKNIININNIKNKNRDIIHNVNKKIITNNNYCNSNRNSLPIKSRNSSLYSSISQRNSLSSIDVIEEIKEEDKDDIFISDKSITYNLLIKVYDQDNKKIFVKDILLNENTHYILDLDKIYYDIISTLNILKINCKYGLQYKLNGLDLKNNIGKINILEYDLSGLIKTEDTYNKNIDMEIRIINEKNITEKEALLNPQLHCRNSKIYLLIPDLYTINKSNLFNYDKGLEIRFKYMSIILTNREKYDLTSINFDELIYDGNTEICFDDINYLKENSSMKKLWDIRICLKYKGIGLLYEDNPINNTIILNYLNKRYIAEYCEIYSNDNDNKEIILITKFINLFLTENESRSLYDEFKKNFTF